MIGALEELSASLRKAESSREKLSLLDAFPLVQDFLQRFPAVQQILDTLPESYVVVCKEIMAIGQLDRLLGDSAIHNESLSAFLKKMAVVDDFYRELGGIVGYQETILKFLLGTSDARQSDVATFHPPSFIDITQESDAVLTAILQGIESLPFVAEMYPLGGAADRLHLVDEKTGMELPAAKLGYAGRTLFEGLIRDLQAREYLFFKLFGKQVTIPIAIMTSEEKENHRHVLQICEEGRWFGRPTDSFRFFTQPLVPAVNAMGDWCFSKILTPLLKPGGHGALWKLARDEGVFKWFESLGKTKALVRQINNPIAAIDHGLISFTGFGVGKQMWLGFASCPRLLQSAEGVNVVVERKNGDMVLTNIEYCDFAKYGIEDAPLKENEPYSRFSSNTNILFVDLKAIERAVHLCPFPGLLVNLKGSSGGVNKQAVVARLESTMQNIADVFVEKRPTVSPLSQSVAMEHTFVTYNQRHKTIATAKRAFIPGKVARETPEECFHVQLYSARELLSAWCRFSLPPQRSLDAYLEQGPEILFLYHPALGPLYSLIAQKISQGSLALGSELQLEIADAHIERLNVKGSLLIRATQPMGHLDDQGVLHYSYLAGRCFLKNVCVVNRGVDWDISRPFWKNCFVRRESLEIILHGFSEFVAEDVTFLGTFRFEVPSGIRMRVRDAGGKLVVEQEELKEAPFWHYEKQGLKIKRQ
ncbi:MAG: UTP--glucose-1-phosphate uridylyltransferase [Chlamydiia bacterium]|nr:UTP--glucose-1-phosphate uridylyltransferase [Chlamydiia bacterium]